MMASRETSPDTERLAGLTLHELLASRRDSGSLPGARVDGATIALVIEGGGMRGIVSAGMVTALEQLRLTAAFDFIIGTSAGALAGAFLLAGQPGMGTSLYYEELVGRDWLDYRRLLRREPPIGLDWLIDDVMAGDKALDWERVIDSPIPLYAVASELPEYRPTVLGPFSSVSQLRDGLRASARIPVMAGKPVAVGGREYVDGSLSQGIPLTCGEDIGFTHVMVLLTRPRGEVRGRPTLLHRAVVFPVMNRLLPGLGTAFSRRADRYRDELAHIAQLEETDSGDKILVAQLPAGAPTVKQLAQDPNSLFSGAAAGATAVYEALEQDVPVFYRGLVPLEPNADVSLRAQR
jgi:predicted patatin/cPLA2 family phospholipase